MNIKYTLLNPTGNITALVETEVPIERQPEIAKQIMDRELTCEQVGYIMAPQEGSDITLRMAGGEFCGNATMSIAAFFCKKEGMTEGETKDINVKVIGTKELVTVKVSLENGVFSGRIKMPSPRKISDIKFVFEGHNYIYPVVEFMGISHVIIEDNLPVYMPESCIKMWCRSLNAKGLGMMLLNDNNTSLRPLVYIENSETMVWESSCASGTSAVGAYFSKKLNKEVCLDLKEPGGHLKVEANPMGEIYLTGTVIF